MCASTAPTWRRGRRRTAGRHVGYLPQNIELFAGTVRDNIARLDEASDEAVVAAAEVAGAHRTVLELDAAYETRIGEGGVPILGRTAPAHRARARGVRRPRRWWCSTSPTRISTATANGRWFVPWNGLRERGVTVVLVAQRAPVMVKADRIVVIKDGAVARYGPADEVLDELRRPVPAKAMRAGHGR